MAPLLSGALAQTIAKAAGSIFLDATLTRGETAYPCKGIFEQWGKYPGPGGALTTADVKILVLAQTLAVEPQQGDIVTLRGEDHVIFSADPRRPAVATDPAKATWELLGKRSPVQGSIYASYGALADAIGLPFRVYRPTPSAPAPVSGNLITTLQAINTVQSSTISFGKSPGDEDYFWTTLADGSQLATGDFLVNDDVGTFFIANKFPLLPMLSIRCNHTASVLRSRKAESADDTPTLGAQPYSGAEANSTADNANGRDQIIAAMPCTIQGRAIGRVHGLDITPSDSPGPVQWWVYLSPACAPQGSIRDGDFLTDDEGYRYQVSAANWTPVGYRLDTVRLEI